MPAVGPRYGHEEYARLGKEVYARQVRPRLTPADDGKYVAVDIDTGEYEVDADDYQAAARLRARLPLAQTWLERAGHPTTYVMRRSTGGRLTRRLALVKV